MPPKKASAKSLAARYASSEDDKESEENNALVNEGKPKATKKGPRATKKDTEKVPASAAVATTKRAQKAKTIPTEIQATQDVTTQSEHEDEEPLEETKAEPALKKARGRPAKIDNGSKNNVELPKTTKKHNTTKKTQSKAVVQEEPASHSEEDEPVPLPSKIAKKAATTKPKGSAKVIVLPEPEPPKDGNVIQETQDDLMAVDPSDASEPEVMKPKKSRGRPPAKSVEKKIKETGSTMLKGEKRGAPVEEKFEEDEDFEMEQINENDGLTNDDNDISHNSHEELVQKYEQLQLSYKGLRELKGNDLETNFKEMQENAKKQNIAATKRIAALEKELSLNASHQSRIDSLEKEIALKDKQFKKDRAVKDEQHRKELAEKDDDIRNEIETKEQSIKKLQIDITQTRENLNKLQQENEILLAKLDAARALASKPNGIGRSMTLEKENLYADLSGLIIRDARPNNEGDGILYDCLQTGKNGTLHFKLDVSEIPDENGGKPEVEVTYTPILDAQRDQQLIEHLEEYMKEEISFPHGNCAKFYTRLASTLQV